MLVEQVAASQYGLFTFEQAGQAGLTLRQIERRVRTGRWERLNRWVLGIQGTPPSFERSVMAAVLAGGDGTVVSHTTLARIHGLAGFERTHLEVTAPLRRQMQLEGVIAHRSRTLFDADVRRIRRIPATSAERLVVDLSGGLGAGELGVVVDELLRRRLVTLPRIADCIARLGRAPGRSPKTVHQVLGDRWSGYDPGESTLETRVLRLIARAGLPLPKQQHRVDVAGRRYRIDLAYPERMVAIECDGFRWHSQRSDWDADRRRQNDLVAQGWRVLRVTAAMTDDEILAAIRVLVCE